MEIKFEHYDPQRHDKDMLTKMILHSDVEMNRLTYGKNATEVIRKLLDMTDSYFTSEYLKCIILNNELVGLVVYYPVSKMREVDQKAGKGFMKAMGFLPFFKKMFLYIKMNKMLGGDLDKDGLYIHTICIHDELRGQGVGSNVIKMIAEENNKMYLYVNMNNKRAIHFYEQNGFQRKHLGKMKRKGKQLGEYLMERK